MNDRLFFEVRDSEVDSQGIVNNHYYFVYLEHARIKSLKMNTGIDFHSWAQEGKLLVLVETQIKFKSSLKPYDKFYIETSWHIISRIKFGLSQKIIRENGDLIALSESICTCNDTNINKFYIPDEIKTLVLGNDNKE